jgi:hypothetical protein
VIVRVNPKGTISCLYTEALELHSLGSMSIQRASFVEPDANGHWWADLSLSHGPRLGPFDLRSEALAAERQWLEEALGNVS